MKREDKAHKIAAHLKSMPLGKTKPPTSSNTITTTEPESQLVILRYVLEDGTILTLEVDSGIETWILIQGDKEPVILPSTAMTLAYLEGKIR